MTHSLPSEISLGRSSISFSLAFKVECSRDVRLHLAQPRVAPMVLVGSIHLFVIALLAGGIMGDVSMGVSIHFVTTSL